MSGTTSLLGLPYPSLTDPPNVPSDIQGLATAVDTELGQGHHVRVHKATTSQIFATATQAAVNWNTTDVDTDGYYSSGSRLTVPTGLGGTYMIGAALAWNLDAGGSLRQINIILNAGTATPLTGAEQAVTSGSFSSAQYVQLSCTTIYGLSAGDYVEVYALQNSGNNVSAICIPPGFPSFWMQRIAATL